MQRHANDPVQAPQAATPAGTRALFVSENPRAGEAIARRLTATPRFASPADAASVAAQTPVDVVVWDLGRARPSFPFPNCSAPIVVLSGPRVDVHALLDAGASAVLVRNVSDARLHHAVAAAQCGLQIIDPSLRGASAPLPQHHAQATLTTRETEVLELMATGGSNKQIATKLGISSHTAKFHIASILAKLGASTRTQAVVRAIGQGILVVATHSHA